MADPILDEIWRMREEMVRKHGGLKGYIQYIQKLDRDHRKSLEKKSKKAPAARGRRSLSETPSQRVDSILDEIWRVQELIKKHGGIDDYFKYGQKVESAQRARPQRKGKNAVG